MNIGDIATSPSGYAIKRAVWGGGYISKEDVDAPLYDPLKTYDEGDVIHWIRPSAATGSAYPEDCYLRATSTVPPGEDPEFSPPYWELVQFNPEKSLITLVQVDGDQYVYELDYASGSYTYKGIIAHATGSRAKGTGAPSIPSTVEHNGREIDAQLFGSIMVDDWVRGLAEEYEKARLAAGTGEW